MAPDSNCGRLELARAGERLAQRYLERMGLEIVARNARTRWGEIDLVARDGATWVFVEVKTRRSTRCGSGAEAVTPLKQHHIVRVAQILLARANLTEVPVRFDVVEVTLPSGGSPRLRHFPAAFEV